VVTMLDYIAYILALFAADDAQVTTETAKSAASVAAAYASMAPEIVPDVPPVVPEPAPEPPEDGCVEGCECGGKGYVVMPDGHRFACPCPKTCKCKQPKTKTDCPNGNCPLKK